MATSTGTWKMMYARSAELIVLLHGTFLSSRNCWCSGSLTIGSTSAGVFEPGTCRNGPLPLTSRSGQERSFQLPSFGALSMSSPKRGSPGRSLMTKNQPGSSLGWSPLASSTVRSKPKK